MKTSRGCAPSTTVNQKVLPTPGLLSTQIRPPMSSTSLAEIVRPRPEPPNRRVVEPSACSNGWKIVSSFSTGMPMPVSATEKRRTALLVREFLEINGHENFAAFGELDGVADQVDQNLAQPAGVADQGLGNVGRGPAGQLESLGMCPQGQGLECFIERSRAGRRAWGRG